jgi:ABC-2 type transport system ATP-binding protein
MLLSARLRSAVALAGRYPVLAGADIDVRAGEVLVLTGPNGAGKTSLLRVLAGLLPLAAGEAEVLGFDPTADARSLRPLVGLLGHRNGLYDDLSAEQNVRFAARAARMRAGTAGEALERMGFGEHLRHAPAGKLSAGQRRRLAIACTLAKRPLLWLLDEPHAGLDAEHRALFDSLLRDEASSGHSVVMASHEQLASSALADRVVAMSAGTVLDGTLAAVPGGALASGLPAAPPAEPAQQAPAQQAPAGVPVVA